jgi:hypothetical protein
MKSVHLLALLLLPLAGAAQAQAIKSEPAMQTFTAAEISAIAMPALDFDEAAVKPEDFEKYFYFHRERTSFDEAYADITECDSLGSGINYYLRANDWQLQNAMSQYGPLAGGIGGAIGGMLADAIFGSAERRRMKRINIRNCMYFKGYDRYGLEKELWQAFHFEEGLNRENAEDREAALKQQARVASGPKPATEVLVP